MKQRMSVAQLIDQLQKYPPDQEVLISTSIGAGFTPGVEAAVLDGPRGKDVVILRPARWIDSCKGWS